MGKIGLYFGSFNPVHIGHMAIAGYMTEFVGLDQVWFVVWEETTELMYVGLVGGVLMVFARGLLAQAPPNMSEVRA